MAMDNFEDAMFDLVGYMMSAKTTGSSEAKEKAAASVATALLRGTGDVMQRGNVAAIAQQLVNVAHEIAYGKNYEEKAHEEESD